MKASGVWRISVSLDMPKPRQHPIPKNMQCHPHMPAPNNGGQNMQPLPQIFTLWALLSTKCWPILCHSQDQAAMITGSNTFMIVHQKLPASQAQLQT